MPITNELDVIHVHIGEVKLGDSGSTLKAILGSCVGIGLIWKATGKIALAHCLLPHGEDTHKSGKFVNQAVETLLKILEVESSQLKELEAVVAGGASMYEEIGKGAMKVGQLNAQAAIEALESKKIRIVFKDLGNTFGRQLILNGQTGEYQVRILEGFKKD